MKKGTFITICLLFLAYTQAVSQKLKSGIITEGLIDVILIDTTERSMADKEMFMEMLPERFNKKIYFNEKYQIELIIDIDSTQIYKYQDLSTGLSYKFLNKNGKKVYCIDSTNYDFINDEQMMKIIDSLSIEIIAKRKIANKVDILGHECLEITISDAKRQEQGYAKFYITDDIPILAEDIMRSFKAYPLKSVIAASKEIEIVFGALKIEPISSEDDVFKMPIDTYELISFDEFNNEMVRF